MSEVSIFESVEFGSVRTVEVNGEPMFVGADVAKALGYAKPNNAVNDHCRCTSKRGIGVVTVKDLMLFTPISSKEGFEYVRN